MVAGDPLSWSTEALIAHKHRRKTSETDRRCWRMEHGPYFDDDDSNVLVIPSESGFWYNPNAGRCWARLGFRWGGDDTLTKFAYTWRRDVRKPVRGYSRPHRPDVWLQSVRKKFYEFYPMFKPTDEKE